MNRKVVHTIILQTTFAPTCRVVRTVHVLDPIIDHMYPAEQIILNNLVVLKVGNQIEVRILHSTPVGVLRRSPVQHDFQTLVHRF